MSQAKVTSAVYWAAISPPRRGRRWIHYDSLRTTKRESIRAFVGDGQHDRTWMQFEQEGWTIERVYLTTWLNFRDGIK